METGPVPRTLPDWDGIFGILESWRAALQEREGGSADPSVTELALERRRDPWSVLVSTILSLRTKDAVTLAASRALLAQAGDPGSLLELTEERVAELAYPAGFYRTKARSLRAIAAILLEKWGGEVPADLESLLALPGVGLKTANLVLSEAFGLDAICVDIHVHRICNRAGWIAESTPDGSEAALRAALPRPYWKKINALLVLFGQKVCTPASPRCSSCPLAGHCARVGVTRSR
ncbi:MAG: endonuclease III [Treponema sp. GWB1_62_6]|nr:MAG: endonuclease III [Treponema sp. GWA1_62_8]OHE68463.1 MAG: endonuclease III [Treponema sp. GWB1_62_6]OHE69118.1 MAG: endonuclease III [Treponema sp. GWC1_61_84]OHE74013.1 MAG: endonuclease III [Treponema sp. RIFOXYC1_FULL_61_9]HCM27084.1 endonuclease III [Treponema sp.]